MKGREKPADEDVLIYFEVAGAEVNALYGLFRQSTLSFAIIEPIPL